MIAGRLQICAAVAVACWLALCASAAAAGVPGSLDPSFDSGGQVGLASGTQLFGVAVASNGEIVATGQSGGSVLVQCYNAAGGLLGQFSGGAGVGRAVAIQPDGKAVVAGTSGGMFVQRFSPNCSPDASFNGGSAAHAPLGGGATGNGVAVAPDGSIVAVGSVPHTDTTGSSTRAAVARFTASGGAVAGFGSGGGEVIDHGHPYAVANAVVVQPDGKIVLAGSWQDPQYPVTSGWIERLTAAGADDPSFGGGSGLYFYSSQGAGYASLNAVTLQGDGKIVASGVDVAGPSATFVRLNTNGTLDTSFGSGGTSLLTTGTFSGSPYGAYGVGVAGGGRIVGAGAFYYNGGHNVGVWSLTTAGVADAEGAFAPSGAVDSQLVAEGCGMAVAPDGGLVVVGDSVGLGRANNVLPCATNTTSSGFVARYVGFGPPPVGGAPSVTTGAASSVTRTSAQVAGQINSNGLSTTYDFEYGPTAGYGSTTKQATLAAGSMPAPVSQALIGLSAGTTYHYRLVASNQDGTVAGADGTFTTAPATAPSVSTGAANTIGEASAVVSGTVNPNGLSTTRAVQYGRTAKYGLMTKAATLPGSNGLTRLSVSLKGLRPATLYHYRVTASNADGSVHGADRTFKTLPRLSVRLSGFARVYRITNVENAPLVVSVKCSQRCALKGSVVISRGIARQLKLAKHQLVLAGGSGTLRHAGSRRLAISLTRQGSRILSGLRQVSVTLRISIRPLPSGPVVTVAKNLTFTR